MSHYSETAFIELLLCTGSWAGLLLSVSSVKCIPVCVRPTLRKVRLSPGLRGLRRLSVRNVQFSAARIKEEGLGDPDSPFEVMYPRHTCKAVLMTFQEVTKIEAGKRSFKLSSVAHAYLSSA